MSMQREKMAKKSIGSLMRKKLSDITNNTNPNYSQQLDTTLSSDNNSIQQLLKERTALIQLLTERNKIIEATGSELQRLRADVKKLQIQNWNLAQSNTHMLAELNMGRERIKTLQHEILWRAALIKGKTVDVQEKVEIEGEKNPTALSQLQEGDKKAGVPSPKASNDEQHKCMNRRRIRSKSTGSSTASKNTNKDKVKDNRRRLRRHSTTFKTHEHEPLENLFELEDATYLVTQSPTSKTERGKSSASRNEATRCSFGRPLRRAVQKVHSYKEIPVNVKMRRLD
ncbi:Shugoshin-1 [Glycine soja]|uniref:Shugoshin-1 n=1 Tax=Glycine soja TaxID=3848 RepID=A0A445I2Y0_GLYSO|nr:shugoshin-1-like isoform X1 [Glycine soja]KHN38709.1 Shugoshin-1 [Glycine soja]RZB80405.1 Shugoshin-1 [Glycine soja]